METAVNSRATRQHKKCRSSTKSKNAIFRIGTATVVMITGVLERESDVTVQVPAAPRTEQPGPATAVRIGGKPVMGVTPGAMEDVQGKTITGTVVWWMEECA